MIKYFCDSCGKEVSTVIIVGIPCHIAEPDSSGYVELPDTIPTSMRDVKFDLCLRCRNRVMEAAFNSIKRTPPCE